MKSVLHLIDASASKKHSLAPHSLSKTLQRFHTRYIDTTRCKGIVAKPLQRPYQITSQPTRIFTQKRFCGDDSHDHHHHAPQKPTKLIKQNSQPSTSPTTSGFDESVDHRTIGKAQELFMLDEVSPGNVFFLPHGARIYNRLQSFLRKEYIRRGYEEVLTPMIFNQQLWEKSGHYQNYKDDMFSVTGASHKNDEADAHHYMLKPMNCPAHCLIFKHKSRSYKDLPVRYADFGVLHRNELSGALTGLTRLRKFQQDDAHIFCTTDQIESEIKGCLEFIEYVYGIFGFNFELELSTRPEKYLGELDVWNKAESELKSVLDNLGRPWKVNPGDGAFYGPKIDVHIQDAHGRKHQCATVQLDFQLPIRFGLEFNTEVNGVYQTPVIIHRAIFGSIERMMAILIEHTEGKWPFWISPRQCVVLPISDKFTAYAQSICDKLKGSDYCVDVDASDKKLQKKIRDAQIAQYNYILVVGKEEMEKGTVNVRTREGQVRGTITLDELLGEFKRKNDSFE